LNPIIKNTDGCYISEENGTSLQLNKDVYIETTVNMTVPNLQAAIPQTALEVTEFQRIIVFYE